MSPPALPVAAAALLAPRASCRALQRCPFAATLPRARPCLLPGWPQVRSICEEMGIAFLGVGFDPKWRYEDVPRMPKARCAGSTQLTAAALGGWGWVRSRWQARRP